MLLVGVLGLLTVRITYDLTYEPAPAVRVEWRKGIGVRHRARLEWKYRLENPEAPHGRSYAYVLSDTSRSNIQSLVNDRDIVGTGDIDRERFEIPWSDWHETGEYTWVADRIPLLRYPLLRLVFIAMLLIMVIAGARQLMPPGAGQY
jgi:hypothetical protein